MQNKLVIKNIFKTISLVVAFIAVLALICLGILFVSTDGHMQIFAANSQDNIYSQSDGKVKRIHKEIIDEPSICITSAYYNDSSLYIYAIAYGRDFKTCTKDNFRIINIPNERSSDLIPYNCNAIKVLETNDKNIYKVSLKFDIKDYSQNSMYTISYIDNNNNEKTTSIIENSYFAQ